MPTPTLDQETKMTEQFTAPPLIPTATTKPRSKWRWLKITIGIVAAGFLAIGLLGSYNPAELELRRRDLFDAAWKLESIPFPYSDLFKNAGHTVEAEMTEI